MRRLSRPGLRWRTALSAVLWVVAFAGAAAAASRTHVIREGETVWGLSRRYDVSVAAIVAANGIDDVRRIPVGARLRIPDPEAEATEAAQPAADAATGEARTETAGPAPAPVPPTAAPTPSTPARTAAGEDGPGSATPGEPGETPETLRALEALVAEARRELRAARFEEALAAAQAAREESETFPASDPVRRLRAALEVVAATAEVALDRYGDAILSFERALEADPGLELDPRTTSPKVLAVFERVRAARADGAERAAAAPPAAPDSPVSR